MILKSGKRLSPAGLSYFNFLRYILFDQVDRIYEGRKDVLPEVTGDDDIHDILPDPELSFLDFDEDFNNSGTSFYFSDDLLQMFPVDPDRQFGYRFAIPRCGPYDPIMTKDHPHTMIIRMRFDFSNHFQ